MATLVNINQSERALKSLLYAMSLTIVALVIYALTSKSWSMFASTMGIGLLVAASALVIGGLLGFLFGIPRTLQQAGSSANNTSTDANAGTPATNSTSGDRTEFQANNWIFRCFRLLQRNFASARRRETLRRHGARNPGRTRWAAISRVRRALAPALCHSRAQQPAQPSSLGWGARRPSEKRTARAIFLRRERDSSSVRLRQTRCAARVVQSAGPRRNFLENPPAGTLAPTAAGTGSPAGLAHRRRLRTLRVLPARRPRCPVRA